MIADSDGEAEWMDPFDDPKRLRAAQPGTSTSSATLIKPPQKAKKGKGKEKAKVACLVAPRSSMEDNDQLITDSLSKSTGQKVKQAMNKFSIWTQNRQTPAMLAVLDAGDVDSDPG